MTGGTAGRLGREIAAAAASIGSAVTLMEVCGTHTVSLRKEGIHSLLPDTVRLVSGPGCPVCVTPTGYIDNALDLVMRRGAVVATFGDMLKVPGSDGTSLSSYLGDERVRIVYSPAECLEIARSSVRPVVFLGIGFETTIPTIASTFRTAMAEGVGNLFLYPAMKTVPAALTALLASDRYFDGFILPGHVSVVIGRSGYSFLEGNGGIPGVVTGFGPLDMLEGIRELVHLVSRRENRVLNAYPRAVREHGNPKARAVMSEVLEPCDAVWRGLGTIPDSGLTLKEEYGSLDARSRFGIIEREVPDPPGCRCAEVILGKTLPTECGLFGGLCTPDRPVGPCMVSSEGTCAAYLRYGGGRL